MNLNSFDGVTQEMLKAVMKKRRIPPHKVKEFFTELIHEMYEKL